MRSKILGSVIVILVLCCVCAAVTVPAVPLPRVFSTNAKALRDLRVSIASGSFKSSALAKLRSDADRALAMEPVSVMQKVPTPPSGDKHDYMSMAPYFWPDPAKTDGLPYIRRDGERNPEIRQIADHDNCSKMINATHMLALAYYLLGDEKYAAKATTLLRAWFLNPATRMNPNLEFAQAIRGVNSGRGIGLIETHGFSSTVDAIGMLAGSKSWTAADQKGMQEWFGKFLRWMQESKNGRDESVAKNNHGSFYDAQAVSIALFTGDKVLAAKILKHEPQRISSQLNKDGGQPLELARTKALGYSSFNLSALFQLACLSEEVGLDLWSYKDKDGKSIRLALDFLTPYVTGEKKWEHQQIAPYEPGQLVPLYVIAARKYRNPQYEQIAQKLDPALSSNVAVLLARGQ